MSSQLHNPFESTYALIKSLRDEIEALKQEVNDLRNAKHARFDALETKVDDLHNANIARFEALETSVTDLRMVKNARFEAMANTVEELRAQKNARFDKLEAALKAEVSDRFATTQSLDKKIRIEVSQLRAHCEKTTIELTDLHRKTEATFTRDLQRHMDLRQDVEKLADVLSHNSMSKDPFSNLGIRPSTPKAINSAIDNRLFLPALTGTQSIKGVTPPNQGSGDSARMVAA